MRKQLRIDESNNEEINISELDKRMEEKYSPKFNAVNFRDVNSSNSGNWLTNILFLSLLFLVIICIIL